MIFMFPRCFPPGSNFPLSLDWRCPRSHLQLSPALERALALQFPHFLLILNDARAAFVFDRDFPEGFPNAEMAIIFRPL